MNRSDREKAAEYYLELIEQGMDMDEATEKTDQYMTDLISGRADYEYECAKDNRLMGDL